MVMLKMNGSIIEEITVSDPSRKLSRIVLTIPGNYSKTGDYYVAIPNRNQNSTLFFIDLPQGFYLGKSISIKL